jgi:hypothetical protein
MFPDDPYRCFDEHPEHEAEPSPLCSSFPLIAEVVEGLLHGLPKLLPECLWIEGEEFLVERTNCFLVIRHMQRFLDRVSARAPM